jgi:uncharacterized ion transporter superfamily protein YfcC
MSANQASQTPDKKTQRSFPTAYTILFALLLFVAALSWVVPAGQYTRVMNEQLGKEVPVPGSYHAVPADPQRLRDVLLAPINGMYDQTTEKSRAIDVALFVLIIGGFLSSSPRRAPSMRASGGSRRPSVAVKSG